MTNWLLDNSIAANLALFLAGAVMIWLSGIRLAVYADALAERTGLGRAFIGALLLGGVTSLPEVATSLTAVSLGNAPLAVNNLMGGTAMQIAVLAVVDLCFVRGALTFFSPKPVILLSGVLLVLQLGLAMLALVSGELISLWHVGLWPLILAGSYLVSINFIRNYEGSNRWAPVEVPDEVTRETSQTAETFQQTGGFRGRTLYVVLVFASICVFAGGWLVSASGDALATQTGIGASFVGATLLALATSLPELSTTTGAVRAGAYTMALSNILGTNSLEVALLLVADIAYREGPIIDAVDPSAALMAALGVVLTCLYLWGLLERRDRTIFGMGIDSALVLAVYVGGLAILYSVGTASC